MTLAAGTRLGPYEVLCPLGAGGMGEVYRARDTKLNRDVALKVLPEAFARDPERMARFQREAQVLASLNHPNIASIYGLEESGGVLALVMELVEGISLKERIVGAGLPTAPGQVAPPSLAGGTGEGKRPPQGVALQTDALLNLAIQIADGLDAAHQKGVVQRDIKPANILITTRGQVKILDFGLAKLTNPPTLSPRSPGVTEGAPRSGTGEGVSPQDTPTASLDLDALTSPGTALGTVAYMSPEQARGEDTDARTDLFSFGAVLYEMATGRMAFSGNTTAVVFDAILHHAPTPPARLNPDVPPKLEEIIIRLLEKDCDLRYQTAADLRSELKRLKRETDSGRAVIEADSRLAVGQAHTVRTEAYERAPGKTRWVWALAGGALLLAAAVYWLAPPAPPPRVTDYVRLTNEGLRKLNGDQATALVTDGARIYYAQATGTWVLMQVSAAGGDTLPVANPLPWTELLDISPSHSHLLVEGGGGGASESPLWALPVTGGSPQRFGQVVGHDATWFADEQRIVYARGQDLSVAQNHGTESRKLAALPGEARWLRWSPDGSRLRFTMSGSLWEVSADGSKLHLLLPGWNNPPAECCGNWTPDGRYFVFQATRNGRTHIWALPERRRLLGRGRKEPTQLSAGPINYYSPVPSLDSKRVFVVGSQPQGELQRYDVRTGRFESYFSGASAEGLDFTRDGQWVAYVSFPEASLWRSKLDGSDRLQLTFPPVKAFLPRWSPDGKRIAFAGATPGTPYKVYTVEAEGGNPQELISGPYSHGDVGWSPDGNRLVFGSMDSAPSSFVIQLLDLRTHQVSKLPGSEGFFSPRWSPDGHYIMTISPGSGDKLLLFDLTTQKWRDLCKSPLWGYPSWSRDSNYIYVGCGSATTATSPTLHPSEEPALCRVRVSDGKLEKLASLRNIRVTGTYQWTGLTTDDSPLFLRDVGTDEIYALNVDLP